jgi:hypothetical protein
MVATPEIKRLCCELRQTFPRIGARCGWTIFQPHHPQGFDRVYLPKMLSLTVAVTVVVVSPLDELYRTIGANGESKSEHRVREQIRMNLSSRLVPPDPVLPSIPLTDESQARSIASQFSTNDKPFLHDCLNPFRQRPIHPTPDE